MKRYIFILFAAFTLVTCSDEFLDEEQVGVLKYDYYESEDGIEKLVNSCYSVLRKKYGDEWTYALWNYGTDEWKRGDHAFTTHAMGGYNDYTEMINPVGYEVGYKNYPENIWAAYYNGLDRCNLAVEKIPLVEDGVGIMKDDAGKNMRMGEVRFLRANFLFLLVQQWGPIPYHLTPSSGSEKEWPRQPVSQVYDDIIADLEFAREHCSEEPADYGRVTKNAARHYLAKVLLTRACGTDTDPLFGRGGNRDEDLARAAVMAEECINSGYNALLPDFADVWIEGNEINDEIVFATQFNQEVGLLGGASNDYRNQSHVYWLNQYDTEAGMARNIEYGRPFRRMFITDYACDIHDRLNDSRLRKSLLEVYYATGVPPKVNAPVWTEQELLFAFTDVAPDGSWAIRYGDTIRAGEDKFRMATENPSNPEYVNLGDTALIFLTNDKNTTLTDREIVGRGYTIFARYYWITDPVTREPVELVDHDTTFPEGHLWEGIRIRAWAPGKAPSLLKFRDRNKADVATYQGTRDFFDARLSETYLIGAEAYGRLGNYTKAVELINVVRRRAAYHEGEEKPNLWWLFDGGTESDVTSGRESAIEITESYWDSDVPLEHYTSPSLSKEQRFIEFMLNERCRELLGEMQRWEDLVRTETLYQRAMMFNDDTRASGTMREYHKLRPIPQTHLDAIETNGRALTAGEKQAYQNPGY